MTKQCPICQQVKDLTHFHKYFSRERGKYRISNYCKPCNIKESLKRAKKHYADHKEAKLNYQKQYRLSNLEKIKNEAPKYKLKYRKELQDCYVREQLKGVSADTLKSVPEIIETKRLQLKIKRKLKQLKNGKK